MRKLKNIGLTGGIATGKSTVSTMLLDRGAIIIDADMIAREVMQPGHVVLQKVVDAFGQEILLENGELDRKKLGSLVFGNPTLRARLNDITHPAIRSEIKDRQTLYLVKYPHQLIVSDIPLLYELQMEEMFDAVMVVYVPKQIQIQRLMDRDGLLQNEAEKRLAAQMDIEIKKERADILIDNSLALAHLESQIDRFWREQVLL
jgi:dephospho-CoA kinase